MNKNTEEIYIDKSVDEQFFVPRKESIEEYNNASYSQKIISLLLVQWFFNTKNTYTVGKIADTIADFSGYPLRGAGVIRTLGMNENTPGFGETGTALTIAGLLRSPLSLIYESRAIFTELELGKGTQTWFFKKDRWTFSYNSWFWLTKKAWFHLANFGVLSIAFICAIALAVTTLIIGVATAPVWLLVLAKIALIASPVALGAYAVFALVRWSWWFGDNAYKRYRLTKKIGTVYDDTADEQDKLSKNIVNALNRFRTRWAFPKQNSSWLIVRAYSYLKMKLLGTHTKDTIQDLTLTDATETQKIILKLTDAEKKFNTSLVTIQKTWSSIDKTGSLKDKNNSRIYIEQYLQNRATYAKKIEDIIVSLEELYAACKNTLESVQNNTGYASDPFYIEMLAKTEEIGSLIDQLKNNKNIFLKKTTLMIKAYENLLEKDDIENARAFSLLLMDTAALNHKLSAYTQELIRNSLYWFSYLGFLIGATATFIGAIIAVVTTGGLAIPIAAGGISAIGYIIASIFMCGATLWRIFREIASQLEHDLCLEKGALTPYMQITVASLCTLLMLLQLGVIGTGIGLSIAFPPAAPFILPAAALIIGSSTFLTPVLSTVGLFVYKLASPKLGFIAGAAIGLSIVFPPLAPIIALTAVIAGAFQWLRQNKKEPLHTTVQEKKSLNRQEEMIDLEEKFQVKNNNNESPYKFEKDTYTGPQSLLLKPFSYLNACFKKQEEPTNLENKRLIPKKL
jgi:hypothetical protein